MTKYLFTIAALVCLIYSSQAQTQNNTDTESVEQDSQDTNSAARRMYRLADVDGNGQLTLQELHAIFVQFDADSNGNVTFSEFLNRWVLDGLGPIEQGIHLFTNLDFNYDYIIDETNDIIGFYHFDTNGDGYITEDEFVAGWLWFHQ